MWVAHTFLQQWGRRLATAPKGSRLTRDGLVSCVSQETMRGGEEACCHAVWRC